MLSYTASLVLMVSTAIAQTFTDCNPLQQTCPPDPAFGRNIGYTSISQTPSGFIEQLDFFEYNNGEVEYVIRQEGNAPTLISESYIFFGSVSVVMRASSGTGIVSSIVLQSDCLDEIDWEFLGGDNSNVQTNYFGKGDTSSYDRVTFIPVENAQQIYHNYTINWSSETIDWIIDDTVVRTLRYAEAAGGSRYPQTPMTVRLGSWAGGASENEGTRLWAGGPTDFSQGPFTMRVRSISIKNASSGTAYEYSDNSGSWESIRVLGEQDSDQSTVQQTGSDSLDEEIGTISAPTQTAIPTISRQLSPIDSSTIGENSAASTDLSGLAIGNSTTTFSNAPSLTPSPSSASEVFDSDDVVTGVASTISSRIAGLSIMFVGACLLNA